MSRLRNDSLGPGSILGHFELLELLGEGGMGAVYKARDASLDRLVALKILSAERFEDEEARARFLREAHLASLLVHPNIATVHEMNEVLGILFIAMELVPGKNLKHILRSGPLPMADLIAAAKQVCDALTAAHRLGIVHRDVKSSNIMVTPDGRVKVLDFGLAKAFSGTRRSSMEADLTPLRVEPLHDGASSSDRGRVTVRRIALGTPSYMSPEQASGFLVDERTDLFSLGVVLFEAATGELPRPGETERRSLARDERFSEDFRRVLSRCLAEEPDERYRSASQVREDLERLERRTSGAAPGKRARVRIGIASALALAVVLAVAGSRLWTVPGAERFPAIRVIGILPFENVSGNPEENYLAAAVPLELSSRLGQIAALKVVPWTFMTRYRDRPTSLAQIRRESGADAVLEGAVALVPPEAGGPRTLVSIQTQLFDTESGILLWSSAMERDLGSFLRVRGEIAQDIAGLVQLRLAQRETLQIASTRVVHPEAMALYLKGREALENRSEPSLERAVEHFEASAKIDPAFAEAYVGLADAYILLSAYVGVMGSERAHRLADDAAKRALAIDDTIGEAWAARAFADYVLAWDWERAEEEFARALELAPSSAEVLHWHAGFLQAIGHHDEALVQSLRAESRSPLSATYSRRVAYTLFFARRYQEAIEQLRKTLQLDPDFVPARTLLGRALVQIGRYDEAIAELQAVGDSFSAMLAQAYAAAGRRKEAEILLQEIVEGKTTDPVLPYEVALVQAALGENDLAFEWLERAFRLRDPTMVSLKTDPLLDPLRGEHRFEELLQRMRFPP